MGIVMKMFGMWYGGSSYAAPDPYRREDIEKFFSIEEAMHEMERRNHDTFYPCIEKLPPDEGGHYMLLYRNDPYQLYDCYPDYILEYSMGGSLKRRKI
jgi:hypothetical protein